ncbi:MAG: GNAT family N-acetyltransferase, partial [Pseudomonadota bacterium]
MDLTPKVLENDWVRLEPLEERHRAILGPVANDPDIWKYMSLRGEGSHFDTWFDMMLTNQDAGSTIGHAVYLKNTEDCIGHSSFLEISRKQKRLEVGWTFYAAAHRGTVVNPACKHLLFTRAIEVGAERVELKTGGKNLHSQRAMEKLGLVKEGTLRSYIIAWTGERRDA